MLKQLLVSTAIITSSFIYAQNIDDNKITFGYIQLPNQKINEAFQKYELRVNHNYLQSNEDSIKAHEARKEAYMKAYLMELEVWENKKKVLEKAYLQQMSNYDKQVKAGGTPELPVEPVYPEAPVLQGVSDLRLNSELNDAFVEQQTTIAGFEKGLGGSILTIDIEPLQDYRIETKKESTGKFTATYYYKMPITVTFETPTGGKIYEKVFYNNTASKKIQTFDNEYEYKIWKIDNLENHYKTVEQQLRNQALNSIRTDLNNEFGYPVNNRVAEIYAVKKFKNYDYSDVTTAYTYTTQALVQVKSDKDRSGAKDKLNKAINAWQAILSESNLTDEKARINDKITAMIYCNLAELYMWKGDFDNAQLMINQAENAGVLKFRSHAKDEQGIIADQRRRWEVHF